jgi:hypothetical protein
MSSNLFIDILPRSCMQALHATLPEASVCMVATHELRLPLTNQGDESRTRKLPSVRACILIGLLPSTRPECWFSTDVLGEWLLAEVDGVRKVTITTGFLAISGLGEFVCKSKHWNAHYYKLLSYYSNGWLVNLNV